jgi:hypothetical protein
MKLHLPHIFRHHDRAELAAALAVLVAIAIPLGFAPGAAAGESKPLNTEKPAITGTPAAGHTLFCSEGSWTSNSKPTFTYRWLRNGTAIDGATEHNYEYEVQGADEGQSLTCEVTAENTAGPESAISAGVTISTFPANTEVPKLTGLVEFPILPHLELALVGRVVSCAKGSWTGSPEPTFTYQWLRSEKAVGGEAAIEGATADSYTVQATDAGFRLICQVTATNTAGARSAISTPAIVATVAAGEQLSGLTPGGQPGGGPPGGANSTGNQGVGVTISYSITTRSGAIFVKLDCSSTTGKCPSVTVRLSVTVVEHLRRGRVTAITAAKTKKTVTRTVVIGSVTVPLVQGSKTVKLALNSAGRRLERQRKTFAAQVQLASGGQVVATEDVRIKRATSQTKKK